uniref:uncharacterized protein LOC124039289 isoform X2 n=1 Tax=Oncorhynchus gorbuscha TaxID=8017 RepID=UPI001EAF89E8|nr:uncharacterized protein LOC124039289 isoform X2 [Oncorhynchus gorbuscha]XP_046211184.1 uncharacterized protein LOC124039289 isoform X2 [Oncorhynchus gorbuscha]XP_046211185.1 uncharacterized protein LOC124039289 isoform X2 [Oncorhynchus gorbuscha]
MKLILKISFTFTLFYTADTLQCYTCESDECSEATLELCSRGEVCSTRTTVFGDLEETREPFHFKVTVKSLLPPRQAPESLRIAPRERKPVYSWMQQQEPQSVVDTHTPPTPRTAAARTAATRILSQCSVTSPINYNVTPARLKGIKSATQLYNVLELKTTASNIQCPLVMEVMMDDTWAVPLLMYAAGLRHPPLRLTSTVVKGVSVTKPRGLD